MPVYQITVVPMSDQSSRNPRGSKENQVSSAPHRAVRTRTSLPSYPEVSSPGTLIKSGERGRTQTSEKIPPENILDPTPITKRHAKRQHRRRQRNGSCVSECAAHSGYARAHADSSSEEEQQRQEARSWSREKARRRRRKRVLARSQSRQDEAPREQGYEELESKEANGGEEEPITKAYKEQEAGDHDMAVPSDQKYTEAPGQNGSTQQVQTDDELEVCRICHCEGDQECPLIAPCRCTGTLRFVHHACLRQWIKSSDTHCCELCKYDFVMETHLKPLHKWENLQMSSSERRKLFCSVMFHLVSVACVFWSLYILAGRVTEELRKIRGANGSLDLSALAESGLLDWLFWTKFGLVAGSVAAGFVFMYVQGKVYLQLWRRLKAFNRVIFVQNCPETSHDVVQTDGAGAEPEPI